jgi:hypothetical protein
MLALSGAADRIARAVTHPGNLLCEVIMNWYKIRVDDGGQQGYTYAGSSPDPQEIIVEKASRGEYIRLDNLVYLDRGDIKDWAQWDKREMPTAYINGARIVAIQQFKADPRTLAK